MISISLNPPEFGYASVSDAFGGKHITIMISPDVIEAVNWVKEHRSNLEKELELRNSNPALATQWDHYQTILRIVMDDV
jgi:hypothetical protein